MPEARTRARGTPPGWASRRYWYGTSEVEGSNAMMVGVGMSDWDAMSLRRACSVSRELGRYDEDTGPDTAVFRI